MTAGKSKKFNPRSLWMPKRPELKEQCVSCPFKEDNRAEFEAVIEKLSASDGQPVEEPGKKFKLRMMADMARDQIRAETTHRGDFSCHHTVYNEDMTLKDESEWKQCPGASKYFVGE